jgi:hypothetical protein
VAACAGVRRRAADARYGQLLARLTTAQELPSLHRAIASGSLDDPDDPDIEFNFGLARILDGIAALIVTKDSG